MMLLISIVLCEVYYMIQQEHQSIAIKSLINGALGTRNMMNIKRRNST